MPMPKPDPAVPPLLHPDSPLASIEITRTTLDQYNAEADRRGLSREAFRAMALFVGYTDPALLDRADHLIRQLHLTSVKDMSRRGF